MSLWWFFKNRLIKNGINLKMVESIYTQNCNARTWKTCSKCLTYIWKLIKKYIYDQYKNTISKIHTGVFYYVLNLCSTMFQKCTRLQFRVPYVQLFLYTCWTHRKPNILCNKSFIKETTRLLRLSGWIKAMYADLYMSKSYIKSKRIHS